MASANLETGSVEKQSDKRMLLIAALVFGLVISAVSVRWLTIGEIVIRRDNEQGRVVGTIKSDHALFYPVCAVWGLLGLTLLVLTPVAYFRNDEFLMKLSAYFCVAILPLGFATVLLAWLAA